MGTQLRSPKRGQTSPSPIFGTSLLWPNGWMHQDATWYRGSLSPDDSVLNGDPPPTPTGADQLHPIFGPRLLRPNGCMDQDATWHEGIPQPRRLCVRWDPAPPLTTKGLEPPPQFSAHFYCGQTAGCIKMPLGMEIASAHATVLDGDPDPYPKRGGAPPSFRPTSIVAKRLHGSRCHLVRR